MSCSARTPVNLLACEQRNTRPWANCIEGTSGTFCMAGTTIIVPCFNEAQRLPGEDFRKFALQWREGTFLFVDDGSTDNTSTIVAALRDSAPDRFQLLRLPSHFPAATGRAGLLAAAERLLAADGYLGETTTGVHTLSGGTRGVGWWSPMLLLRPSRSWEFRSLPEAVFAAVTASAAPSVVDRLLQPAARPHRSISLNASPHDARGGELSFHRDS